MIIDLHNHIYMEEFFDDVSPRFAGYRPRIVPHNGDVYRFEIRGTSYRPVWANMFSLEHRFADMDRLGIDQQAIAVPPFMFWYNAERELQVESARSMNNHIAALVRQYPQRFVGVANVPLGLAEDAADELERAVTTLDMRAVQIGTNVNGKYLDDPALAPFLAKAEELATLIIVHPQDVAAADKLAKYYTINSIGNPLDTTIAIASVIFGGVIEQFPRLKLYFVHGGGFAPYQRGRFEHAWEYRPEPREHIRKPPSHYFARLYFDTITFFTPALHYLVASVGTDKVILGTDYPFDMQDFDPVRSVLALDLPEADRRKILGENAAVLLRQHSPSGSRHGV